MHCKRKKVYFSRSRAKKAARRIMRQHSLKLYDYACHECGNYHLTSMSRRRYRVYSETAPLLGKDGK